MCGFLGFIGQDTEIVHKDFINAFESINHRGPDNSEIFHSENFLLGFKRLAIIDLESRSNQPYSDGKNFLLFNGEIYNYKKLKQDLVTEFGCHFETMGDTEVLFNGLKHKGAEFLSDIDGMFALCFISSEGEILLARDRYGQKPLFYNVDNSNNLVFGSEQSSIIKFLGIESLEVNEASFNSYFQYGASIAPNTFFKGLMQVIPGEFVKFNSQISKASTKNWSEMILNEDSKISVKEAIANRLKACYVSDSPIALLSSGGIDSSALVKTASCVTSSVPTLAFHLRTTEDQEGLKISKKLETPDLPLMVANSGSISNKDTSDLIDLLLKRFGEPFSDTSYFYSEELYSSIPEKYKVIIGGDGADEVFKGYKPAPLFFVSSVISRIIPVNIRSYFIMKSKSSNKFGLIFRILLGCQESMERLLMGFGSNELSKISHAKLDHNQNCLRILGGKDIKEFYHLYLDTRLKNVFMKKADHASMKYSKELRSPYLQNDPYDFIKKNNLFNNLIPKFNLKIYLLDSLNFFGTFRKKVGFDMKLIEKSDNRKEGLIIWCRNNESLINSYFKFDQFINLITNINKDSHIFRIEVFLTWIKAFHEKK